jgi:hypothetical protein
MTSSAPRLANWAIASRIWPGVASRCALLPSYLEHDWLRLASMRERTV